MSQQNPAGPDTDSDTASPEPPPARRPSRFPPAARWTVVFFVVIIALIVAIWPRGTDPAGTGLPDQAGASDLPMATDAPADPAQLAQARTEAALAGCPQTGQPVAPQSVLAGVTAPCLASGAPYDVGAGTAGMPMVINMWAVWCTPCRRELPVLDDYATRAQGRVTVLAVHAKEGANSPFLVLKYLAELGVRLPTVLDTEGAVAAALQAPRVFPSTIIVRPDGTVAKVLPQLFDTPDQFADAVAQYTGVRT